MSLQNQPELQDNEQGQATSQGTEPLEKHMKALIYGGGAVIVVIVLIIAVTSTGAGAMEAGWSRFAEAASASDFANVASDFPGTEVAVWARLREAELLLAESIRLQFSDRAAADSQLKDAGEAFDAVIDKAASLPEARERALLGKARLLEATSDGDLTDAIAAYKAFCAGFPESIWFDQIQTRIKTLESGDTSDFYAWFSKQNPKPEDRQTPTDGLPSGHPEIPVSLPAIPDELIPADWSEIDTPGTNEATATEDEEAAAEDASADDAPADAEKAADAEKPADSGKPTEE